MLFVLIWLHKNIFILHLPKLWKLVIFLSFGDSPFQFERSKRKFVEISILHPIHFVAKKFNFNYLCFHQVKANNLSSFQWKNNLKGSFSKLESLVTSSISFLLQKSELIWSESYTSDPDKSTFSIWWLCRKERERAKNIQDRKKVVIIPCGLYKNRLDVSYSSTLPYSCYQKTVPMMMMILSVQFPTIREKCLSK